MQLQILGHWCVSPLNASGAASSYLVREGQASVLLDCGQGTLPLLLSQDVLPHLDAIVISHMHYDHFLDIVPLSTLLIRHSICGKMKLYVPEENGLLVLQQLADLLFAGENRFAKAFELIEYGADDQLIIGTLQLNFMETVHSMTCYAPRITNGRETIVYSADTAYFEGMSEHARGADLLLCEATLLDAHPSHMTGEQAGQVAAKAEVKRLVLTHLSHESEVNERNWREARRVYSGIVDLAATGAAYLI